MFRNNIISLISNIVISSVYMLISLYMTSLLPQIPASIIFFVLVFIYIVLFLLVGRFLCVLQASDIDNFLSVISVSILNLILVCLSLLRLSDIATAFLLTQTTGLIGSLLEWTKNEGLKLLAFVIPLTNSFIIFLGLQIKKVNTKNYQVRH